MIQPGDSNASLETCRAIPPRGFTQAVTFWSVCKAEGNRPGVSQPSASLAHGKRRTRSSAYLPPGNTHRAGLALVQEHGCVATRTKQNGLFHKSKC